MVAGFLADAGGDAAHTLQTTLWSRATQWKANFYTHQVQASVAVSAALQDTEVASAELSVDAKVDELMLCSHILKNTECYIFAFFTTAANKFWLI